MNKVQLHYEGDSVWAKGLQRYLNQKLSAVASLFPKILEHIEGLTMKIIEKESGNLAYGYYNRLEKMIVIISGNCDSRREALHTLFHEIGHAVIHKQKGLASDYDPIKKNASYFREEIRAESYALQIFWKYLKSHEICYAIRASITELYRGLKHSQQARTMSLYWSTSNTVSVSTYPTWSQTNSTTWKGTITWATTSVTLPSWNRSISLAC